MWFSYVCFVTIIVKLSNLILQPITVSNLYRNTTCTLLSGLLKSHVKKPIYKLNTYIWNLPGIAGKIWNSVYSDDKFDVEFQTPQVKALYLWL